MALRRRTVIWLAGITVPIAVTAAVLLVHGWDLLIPIVASQASTVLRRPVTIAHLHISPGRIMSVTADNIVVGNPPNWSPERPGEPLVRVPRLYHVDVRHCARPDGPLLPGRPGDSDPTAEPPRTTRCSCWRLSSTKIGEVRIEGGEARQTCLKADMIFGIMTWDQANR